MSSSPWWTLERSAIPENELFRLVSDTDELRGDGCDIGETDDSSVVVDSRGGLGVRGRCRTDRGFRCFRSASFAFS